MDASEAFVSLSSTPPSDLPPRVQPLRLHTPVRPPAAGEAMRPSRTRRDRLELSAAGRELAAATQSAAAADADRAELVLRIRQQIAEGGYEPDAEAVARALLERLEG